MENDLLFTVLRVGATAFIIYLIYRVVLTHLEVTGVVSYGQRRSLTIFGVTTIVGVAALALLFFVLTQESAYRAKAKPPIPKLTVQEQEKVPMVKPTDSLKELEKGLADKYERNREENRSTRKEFSKLN